MSRDQTFFFKMNFGFCAERGVCSRWAGILYRLLQMRYPMISVWLLQTPLLFCSLLHISARLPSSWGSGEYIILGCWKITQALADLASHMSSSCAYNMIAFDWMSSFPACLREPRTHNVYWPAWSCPWSCMSGCPIMNFAWTSQSKRCI